MASPLLAPARANLLERAASCYEQAGLPAEAARCYADAGAHLRAATLYDRLDMAAEAAAAYRDGGLLEQAAWTLVDRLGDTTGARAVLPHVTTARTEAQRLSIELVLARCHLAEDGGGRLVPATLRRAADLLANRSVRVELRLEEWAVAVAIAAHRFDQVALIFAAAIRGRRPRARERWQAWSERQFGAPVPLAWLEER
ncbi:hypothetical protein AB0K00_41905 [Dactylosporangium sp. NPDC049525]|uniref:hypothetical protein n=1 Tax=Dactylosporangium sp. NPDC049525 TaxID=3154730 RepID=UPI003414CB56